MGKGFQFAFGCTAPLNVKWFKVYGIYLVKSQFSRLPAKKKIPEENFFSSQGSVAMLIASLVQPMQQILEGENAEAALAGRDLGEGKENSRCFRGFCQAFHKEQHQPQAALSLRCVCIYIHI